MSNFKMCKICGESKDRDEFRINTRMCRGCQDVQNKLYMVKYYEQNRKRLIEMNLNAYYEKNPIRKKMGRPRKYNIEEETQEYNITC